MNYTDKIEAYTAGKMSALEQVVFEQELAENGGLKEAFEAHQLTEALLGFTANNLSEAAILGNTSVPESNATVSTSKTMYYGAGLLALCLIGLFTFIYTSSSTTKSPSPIIEATQVIATPNEIATPVNQKAKETIIFQDLTPEVQPAQMPKPTPSKVRTKKSSKPVAAIQKKMQRVKIPIPKADPVLANFSSNKQVNNGEAIVFTAGESITLEPGFVVEAGASFQAVITDKDFDR